MDTMPIAEAAQQSFKDELNPKFERRKWAFDRVIWVLMLAVVVAALLGVFGSGILSRQSTDRPIAGGTVELQHPRFARYHSPEDLRVNVVAPEANGDVLRLSLSSEFTGQVTVRQVNPQPDTVVIGSGGTTYEWHVSDWSQPVGVDVEYEPDDWGRISGAVVVEAGDAEMVEIGFDQIVFP